MFLSSHIAFIPSVSYTCPFWPFPEILVHSIYLSSIYMYNTRFTLLTNFKMYNMFLLSCCFSVTQLCLTLCSPMDCCMPGFFVPHYLPEFVQTHAHWVDGAIQSSHPLLPFLLLSIFPSIRVFFNESALHIRWPEYCSFSFSTRYCFVWQISRVYSCLTETLS